jgi:hypothetical protein
LVIHEGVEAEGPTAAQLIDAEALANRIGALVILGLGPDLPLPFDDSAARRSAAKAVKL